MHAITGTTGGVNQSTAQVSADEDWAPLARRCRQSGHEVCDGTNTQMHSYETKTFQGLDNRTTERNPGISYVPEAEDVWHDQGPRMC